MEPHFDIDRCPNCEAANSFTPTDKIEAFRSCVECGFTYLTEGAERFFEDPLKRATELEGTPLSPGKVQGPVAIVPYQQAKAGQFLLSGNEIVVTDRFGGELTNLSEFGGIVSATGDRTSVAGVFSRELRIPAIGELPDALDRLEDGLYVELDGTSGRLRPMVDETTRQ